MLKPLMRFLLVLLLLTPSLVLAQDDDTSEADTTDEAAEEATTDATDLTTFGLTIPRGWRDDSNDNYAHFINDETGAEIYVLLTDETNQQAAMQLIIETVIDENFAIEPIETVELDRANGIWTQNRYILGTDDRLTATVQRSADDLTFVVLQRGSPEALEAAEATHDAVLANIFITPDNSDFLALGMGAAFVLLALFILSMIVRYNSLRKDVALLKRLSEEEPAT
ncbi:MAG: hypothetical protein D6737_10065 [Chloroflexi bacterium]|nr:MAG: hypothetical protein D6737_10065 [Chloroflexota bacterium]